MFMFQRLSLVMLSLIVGNAKVLSYLLLSVINQYVQKAVSNFSQISLKTFINAERACYLLYMVHFLDIDKIRTNTKKACLSYPLSRQGIVCISKV